MRIMALCTVVVRNKTDVDCGYGMKLDENANYRYKRSEFHRNVGIKRSLSVVYIKLCLYQHSFVGPYVDT